MALKEYRPITSSTRGLVLVKRLFLWKGEPEKTLVSSKKRTGGRNNLGRITAWRKGGGAKQKYRLIDFKRNKLDVVASVERIEYDPNRTAFIALIKYEDGELSYIIAPQHLSIGDRIVSSIAADIKIGNRMEIRNIPVGSFIHNIELKIGKGGQLARSAGTYAQLISKDIDYSMIRLRSGEVRMVLSSCCATIGVVSNPDNQNIMLAKAGRSRWLGRRPTVRGVAMNPVDHPHGGGEGKTSGGRHPVSAWGKPTKGKKTRNPKRSSKHIVTSRHAKK